MATITGKLSDSSTKTITSYSDVVMYSTRTSVVSTDKPYVIGVGSGNNQFALNSIGVCFDTSRNPGVQQTPPPKDVTFFYSKTVSDS